MHEFADLFCDFTGHIGKWTGKFWGGAREPVRGGEEQTGPTAGVATMCPLCSGNTKTKGAGMEMILGTTFYRTLQLTELSTCLIVEDNHRTL